MFSIRHRMLSTPKNASATATRLLAESSNVRSNHWVPAVKAGFRRSTITYRAMEVTRSLRMGLRL